MAGEPEFDVAPFLWNPIGRVPTKASVQSWIDAFARSGLDAERIRKWAIVRGAYLGLPISAGESEETSVALRVARALL